MHLHVFLQLLMVCGFKWAAGQFVVQPKYTVATEGERVTVQCHLQDSAYYWMYWYRQESRGGELQALVSSGGKDDLSYLTNGNNTFQAERPKKEDFRLVIASAMPHHASVYFCACSSGTGNFNQLYFGTGTKLTVLEDGLNVTQPSVVLFDPSPQELREKGKATLVCLATNFYPDHVTLRWSVNGVETTTGVKTDDSPTRGSDRMYSLSSRLRLPKRDWRNPHNTFRCSVYFDPKNITVSKETKGRKGCGGVTPDSYRTSANTAKLTYFLLISKSALYGLFVTFLAWKLKACREKPFI